jgi:hypothetical protein
MIPIFIEFAWVGIFLFVFDGLLQMGHSLDELLLTHSPKWIRKTSLLLGC